MISAWRITTKKFIDTAFSGEGARLYGGRWNSVGIPVVYTAESRSLAMLEMLVQDTPLRANYVFIPVSFPKSLVIEIELADLPNNWRSPGGTLELQALGKKWFDEKQSAVLSVPSAVIPAERNFILNPTHSDFNKVKIEEYELMITDLRL